MKFLQNLDHSTHTHLDPHAGHHNHAEVMAATANPMDAMSAYAGLDDTSTDHAGHGGHGGHTMRAGDNPLHHMMSMSVSCEICEIF